MATEFEQIRKQRSRPIVGFGVLLWLFALITAIPFGIVPGVIFGVVLQGLEASATELVGIETDVSVGWMLGLFGNVALVVIGYPLALAKADRVGPWLAGAREANPNNPGDRVILDSIRAVALAAQTNPIVYLVEASWVNAAALGTRDGRPVIITTTGAVGLSASHRQVLAASVLSESLSGAGANRVWLATRSPALWPMAFARAGARNLNVVAAFVGAATMASVVVNGSGTTIVGLFLLGILSAIGGALYLLWLAGLSAGSRILAAQSHHNADVGSIALLRYPEQWRDAMVAFGEDTRTPPFFERIAMEWILPFTPKAAHKRIEKAQTALPAVAYSLAASASTD